MNPLEEALDQLETLTHMTSDSFVKMLNRRIVKAQELLVDDRRRCRAQIEAAFIELRKDGIGLTAGQEILLRSRLAP